MSKQTKTEDVVEILVRAIREEPYFDEKTLIPKIKAIIKGFRLRLSANNYNLIENPTKTAQLIRANELHNLEKYFWKNKLEELVGKTEIQKYYKELEDQRLTWTKII